MLHTPDRRRLAVAAAVLFLLAAGALAQDRPAYPWTMPLEEVATFSSLIYNAGAVVVTFAEGGHCAPIIIQLPDAGGQNQPAVTGMEVLGNGTIKVQQGNEVLLEDQVYGAMFRFHPEDFEAFVTIEGKQANPDPGRRAQLEHLCIGSFGRFWHRGNQAFVPDRAIAAAWVYAVQNGGVMVWQSAEGLGAYCMDTKTELFKR